MLTERSSTHSPPPDLTDAAAAELFVEHFCSQIRYCASQRSWYIWTGSHWEPDTSLRAEQIARQWSLRLWRLMELDMAPEIQRSLQGAIHRRQSATAIRSLLECARCDPRLSVRREDWNQDGYSLNVANGTLDLRTGELKRHDGADMFNLAAPVAFDPNADCPQFKAFITRIMDGEVEMVQFLQRVLGYILTGETSEQCAFVLVGSGANGKSTLLETFRALLGAYVRQANFDTFQQQWGSRVRQDIARLQGARLVTASEANEGAAFDEALVKQLTGGDVVTSRFLWGREIEYIPQFKVVLACNHLPRIHGTDHGIWRRIRVIPFPLQIAEKDQDRNLGGRLRNELSGILNWTLEGCREWQRDGLGTPSAVEQATSVYRAEMDPFPSFFEECCQITPGAVTPTRDILFAYRRWSEQNGLAPKSDTWLGKRLSDRNIGRRTSNGVSQRTGLRLRHPSA